jgi:hypothetical protein
MVGGRMSVKDSLTLYTLPIALNILSLLKLLQASMDLE